MSWGPGRIDLAALSLTGAVYDNRFDGATWKLGSAMPPSGTASAPAISSRCVGKLDVFVYGPTGTLWHRAFSAGTWQAWTSLPFGTFTGDRQRPDLAAVDRRRELESVGTRLAQLTG